MNVKPVAIATVKVTQERYFVYNTASYTNEDKVYALHVNCAGHVTYCSCPDHKFRKHDCKHMEDLQAQIDTCKAARKAIAQEKALVTEITAELEAERMNELACIEEKEVALASAVEKAIEAEMELAKATESKKFHAGMFLSRGVSTYVSDAEMAELKARVKARKELALAEQKEVALEASVEAVLEAKQEAAMRVTMAAYQNAQEIAADRRGSGKAFNAVKDVVRNIERFGCRYDFKGYEYHAFEITQALPKVEQKDYSLLPTFTNGERLKAAPVIAPKVVNIRTLPLNGNQGFSLLKVS